MVEYNNCDNTIKIDTSSPKYYKRFWSKVNDVNNPDPNKCWEWQKSLNQYGYGRFEIQGKDVRVHRVAYINTYGTILPDKPLVLHKCNNPKCCNPNHLYVGTNHDNTQQMHDEDIANNIKIGIRNPNSRLEEVQVRQIRELYKTGKFTLQYLADKYNVCFQSIWNIANYKSWKHIN